MIGFLISCGLHDLSRSVSMVGGSFVVSLWCYGVWWLALVSAKLAVYSDNEDNDDDNDPVMVT